MKTRLALMPRFRPVTPWRALLTILMMACAFVCPSLGQQSSAPGDIYLEAYLLLEDAQKLETQSQFSASLRKFSETKKILEALARNHPEWRPEVVTYRRRKVNEAIARCRAQAPSAEHGTPLNYNRTPAKPYVPPANTSTGESLIHQKDAQIRSLESQRDDLMDRLGLTQNQLQDTVQRLRVSSAAQTSLSRDLTKAREQLQENANNPEAARRLEKQIKRLTDELSIANEALKNANQLNQSLETELQRANDMVASLRTERDELRKERERMGEILKSSEDGDVKELLAANMALKSDLEEARALASKLAGEKERDSKQIAALQERLAGVEKRLADLQQENSAYEERIASLSAKLRETESNLNQALDTDGSGSSTLTKSALEENRALRDIVKRQMKQQAFRQRTKQLLMAELDRRGDASRELIAQIEEIAGNGAILTPREQELLRDSLLNDLGGNSGMIIGKGGELPDAEYPQLAGHNDGALSPIGLNENLTEFARATAIDFAKGNFEACESSYQSILGIAPNNVYALRNLGIVEMRLGKNQQAEKTFREAISRAPRDGYSHFILGVYYYRTGMDDLAMDSMDAGLEISPDNARAHHYLGAMCIKRGLRERARQEFQSVVAIDPTFGDAYYNLAYLYVTDSPPRLDLARQFYRQAQQNGTKSDAAMNRALGT